jgi:20S proteasome subunit beta 4
MLPEATLIFSSDIILCVIDSTGTSMLLILFFLLSILFLNSEGSFLLFGFKGKNCVALSSSTGYSTGLTNYNPCHKWIRKFGDTLTVGINGRGNDSEVIFSKLEEMNLRNQVVYDRSLLPLEAAEICRKTIADVSFSGSGTMLHVGILVGGWDPVQHSMRLFWIDYLGSLKEVEYGAHGYEQDIIFSILDHQNNPYDADTKFRFKEVIAGKVESYVEDCWNCVRRRSIFEYSKHQLEIITKPLE